MVLVSNVNIAQNKIRFGVQGGMTYSSLRGNKSAENLNSGIDFLVGVSLEYQIKERLSLIANVSYDRKSVNDKSYIEIIENPEDPGFYGKVKIIANYQYLSIPVLLKYDFGDNDSFYINGGPFLGYLLKSQLSNDYDNSSTDTTDDNKKMDFGLTFGIGKTFKLNSNQEITVEIRDNLGLSNTSKIGVVDNGSIKTNSLNLICGWSFN